MLLAPVSRQEHWQFRKCSLHDQGHEASRQKDVAQKLYCNPSSGRLLYSSCRYVGIGSCRLDCVFIWNLPHAVLFQPVRTAQSMSMH